MFKVVKCNTVGGKVYQIKRLLNAHGFKMSENGDYDDLTRLAILVFQNNHHITRTGAVDFKTWVELNKIEGEKQ